VGEQPRDTSTNEGGERGRRGGERKEKAGRKGKAGRWSAAPTTWATAGFSSNGFKNMFNKYCIMQLLVTVVHV
jgi:hypothetical protein